MIYGEVHGVGDEALSMSSMVETNREISIILRTDGHVRAKHDPGEPPSQGGLFNHLAGCLIGISKHYDSIFRTQVQIPKFVAGGQRRDEQLLRVPTLPIAAEGWIR
jgi:hypothetical protein